MVGLIVELALSVCKKVSMKKGYFQIHSLLQAVQSIFVSLFCSFS